MLERPPTLSLRQLQYIVAIAKLGSFRKAAALCRVAQPSLSAQLAEAEGALGVRLFERDRRHVHLTEAGALVVERASQLLTLERDLVDSVQSLRDPFAGNLRLGVLPTIAPYFLPRIVPTLTKRFSKLRVQWHEGQTADLVERVKNGALDGAIVASPSVLGDLPQVALFDDPFFVALCATHPLAKRKGRVLLDELAKETFLLLDEGHCLREQVLPLCQIAKSTEHSFRATSLSTLTQMVASGLGLTLLPKLAIETESRRAKIRILTLAPPTPGRIITLVYRRGGFREPLLGDITRTLTGAKEPR
jgi:LysR family hydrogen peroxide-inducible transcriptional activator